MQARRAVNTAWGFRFDCDTSLCHVISLCRAARPFFQAIAVTCNGGDSLLRGSSGSLSTRDFDGGQERKRKYEQEQEQK